MLDPENYRIMAKQFVFGGSLLLIFSCMLATIHYVFRVPFYVGHSRKLQSMASINSSLFVFGGVGLFFLILGVFVLNKNRPV